MKIETERISNQLTQYCKNFVTHEFFRKAREKKISRGILEEFAFYQYSDSILWIPMLSQMKSKASRSQRLQKAIDDNIKCEAGIGGVSHITMARDFMRSLGIKDLSKFPKETFTSSASMWLSDEFSNFSEAEVAGWLLTAETLVPLMFQQMLPVYEGIDGCDVKYFKEHIEVDVDEHSAWMMESVEDVLNLYGKKSIVNILEGMRDANEETMEIPNLLLQKAKEMAV